MFDKVEPRREVRRKDDISYIKLRIPSFHGRHDPEAYFKWERKTELIFDSYECSEDKKVELAVGEFKDCAESWWHRENLKRYRMQLKPIRTWERLKSVMRNYFIPNDYYCDLYYRFLNLNQGARSVKEYYQEMEMIMTRTEITESQEAIINRFLRGLNSNIRDVVQSQYYTSMTDLLYAAIEVERRVKHKKTKSSTLVDEGDIIYAESETQDPTTHLHHLFTCLITRETHLESLTTNP